ncbi:MAG TPA: DUF255 domain-containing protein [Saprospiraceae bacterium]|nr:DUF255 domain-containing protein [Saprospiraceae bacterium]
MAEDNSHSYSSDNFLLDFSKEIIPVQLKVSETLNLQFNGYHYSFNAANRSIGWSPGIKDLEFYFDFNSENLSKEISFLAKDLQEHKLKYLWGTTALLSFFLFISNGNFSTHQTVSSPAAVITAPANRPFKALAALAAVERKQQKESEKEIFVDKNKKTNSTLLSNPYLEESFSEITQSINREIEHTTNTNMAAAGKVENSIELSPSTQPAKAIKKERYIVPHQTTKVALQSNVVVDNTKAKKSFVSKTNTQQEELVGINKASKSISFDASLNESLSKAVLENKQLIIGFGAKWCLPCKLMENSTFKDKAVKQYLKEHYIMLKIDVDDFDGFNLKQHYEVNLLPTFIVFDQDGKIKARYEESFSAKDLLKVLVQNNSSRVSNPMELLSTTNGENLKQVPASPSLSVEIVDVSLLKNRKGKTISKLKPNGRNWNYTSVQFHLESDLVHQIQGEELLVKIVNTDTKELLSQVTLSNFATSNKVEIAHPWQKHLAKNYSVQIFLKKADGTLSQLKKGDKSIISNHTLIM